MIAKALDFSDVVDIVFVRKEGFYLASYPRAYSDWEAEAERNEGTIRIESMDGKVLYQPPEP